MLRSYKSLLGSKSAHLFGGLRSFKQLIDLHPLVERSLRRNEPVVALESTIITHGMPHPHNLETAREVEQLVRTNGATPATIAILNGRIKVGLSETDLVALATMLPSDVIKCSRRDLPFVIAKQQNGGTTVAATMIIAHMVGLNVFATGGVGGVHRDGHSSMDVSADLMEFGRTPITVVCSGVKSILDIPRTLEFLETQGVCVASYGVDDCCFPDFYTRDSGCKVPYNLKGPEEAAHLITAQRNLKLQSGILIGVPIPEQFAADKIVIQTAINQAYSNMQVAGVSGKQVTPFLLAAIAKITKGKSLAANMALIKNNASVAAQIAVELHKEKRYLLAPKKKRAPLVIGATILDLSLTMLDDIPTTLDGATYQVHTVKQSAGGVGRNLAEGIFKLHGTANLISIVGDDQMGKSLLHLIPLPLRKGVEVDADNATSLCSVLIDKKGDCKLVLGNMEIHQKITPDRVQQSGHLLSSAPLIVIDGNLPLQTMECVLQMARQRSRPVFFEPTDMRIAGKPFTLPHTLTQQIKIISPNIHELKTIVETMTQKPWQEDVSDSLPTEQLLAIATKMLALIKDHFDCVVVTLGHHGVLLRMRAAENRSLFDLQTGDYLPPTKEESTSLRFYAAPTVQNVANVSGAGDSFSSGFITGLLRGYTVDRCVAMGFIAAERALQSDSAVPGQYFDSEKEETVMIQKTLRSLKSEQL